MKIVPLLWGIALQLRAHPAGDTSVASCQLNMLFKQLHLELLVASIPAVFYIAEQFRAEAAIRTQPGRLLSQKYPVVQLQALRPVIVMLSELANRLQLNTVEQFCPVQKLPRVQTHPSKPKDCPVLLTTLMQFLIQLGSIHMKLGIQTQLFAGPLIPVLYWTLAQL